MGHAFVQNLRRGHYEFGLDVDTWHRLPVVFVGDRVFVRYADGRQERLAPVGACDAGLVELIRELAARGGGRGTPVGPW